MIGHLEGISRDYKTGKWLVTFSSDDNVTEELEGLQDKNLNIKVSKFRKTRSLQANKFFWALVGEISRYLGTDSWETYLFLLKRYGKYTYIEVIPEAVEAFKATWRECQEVGRTEDRVSLICYFGSHTYNSQEFSQLVNGTLDEMREMGLKIPLSDKEMEALYGISRNK